MFDLSTLDTTKAAEEGATLEVRHPTTGIVLMNGEAKPVTLTLAGSDSDRAMKAERAALNRRFKANANRRGTSSSMTAEELDSDTLDKLAACTLGWSGFVVEGSEVECTPANARQLYRQWPWLREQAQAFVDDRANFLKG